MQGKKFEVLTVVDSQTACIYQIVSFKLLRQHPRTTHYNQQILTQREEAKKMSTSQPLEHSEKEID